MNNRSLSSPNSRQFTIVIPTLDRAELLDAALHSVRWQDFDDFEVVISDNCSTDSTSDVAARFLEDARFRYVRPDTRLNMPDHWEFATKHARGRYVLILTDRHVMRPSALRYLAHTIAANGNPPEAICWFDQSQLIERSGRLTGTKFSGAIEEQSSRWVSEQFAKFTLPWHRLPHSLNSCYRSDVADTIRKEQGRLFIPASPDFTSEFLLLADTDKVLYLDRPLYVGHGTRHSNGANAGRFGCQAYAATLGINVFRNSPCQADCIVNTITSDFLGVCEQVGDRLGSCQFDIEAYATAVYGDLCGKKRGGGAGGTEGFRLWNQFVATLEVNRQIRVMRQVRRFPRGRHIWIGRCKRLAAVTRAEAALGVFAGCKDRITARIQGETLYADALDAAWKTNHFLSPAASSVSSAAAVVPTSNAA